MEMGTAAGGVGTMVAVRGSMVRVSVAGVVAASAGLAWAGVPTVLDRVPQNAAIVITVDNMESSAKRLKSLDELFGGALSESTPMSDTNPMTQLDEFLSKPGVKKSGSMAWFGVEKNDAEKAASKAASAVKKAAQQAVEVKDDEGNELAGEVVEETPVSAAGDEMDFYGLVPVTDYAAFVQSLKAKGDVSGVVEVQMDEANAQDEGATKIFARNAGDGYALMGDNKTKLETMKLATGNSGAFKAMLGTAGGNVADKCGVLIIANMAELRDNVEQGLQDVKEGQGAGGMQMMPGMEANVEMFTNLARSFARDAQVGVVGIGVGDKGIWFDLAAQFREGTEMAGYFTEKRSAGSMLARLPKQPFLAAFAMDYATPGMRKIMAASMKMNEENMKNMAMMMGGNAGGEDGAGLATNPFAGMMAQADKSDGYAMVMGATPAGMMGGFFINSVMYVQTSDAAAYMDGQKQMLEKTNGKQFMGINYKTSFTKDAKQIAGTSVDQWGITMQPDPKNQMGQQMMMMQGMMFGPNMGGYAAKVDGGLLMTMSKNEALLESALSAKGGFDSDVDLLAVRQELPADRNIEGYLGVKHLIDTGMGLLGMFMGAPEVELPEKISPIGFGGSMHSGGAQMRFYVPNDAVQAIQKVGKAMQEMRADPMMDMGEEEDMDGGEAPKF